MIPPSADAVGSTKDQVAPCHGRCYRHHRSDEHDRYLKAVVLLQHQQAEPGLAGVPQAEQPDDEVISSGSAHG